MKLLLFPSLFVGWTSYYLCQRTLPSALANLIDGESAGEGTSSFSKTYIGQLQSLFAVAYSTSFLISGIMSDAVDVRTLFPVCLAASGLLLAIFPWTEGNPALGLVVYFLMGLTQGCGWPSTAKILRQNYRPAELGVPWGIMSTGSSIAALLSPFLVSTIITNSGSWKYSFYAFGAIALLLSPPVGFITKFSSSDPVVSNTKQRNTDRASVRQKPSRLRWFHVFLVRDLWGVMAIHSVLWLVKASIQDWGQLYLVQEKGFDKLSAGNAVGLMQFGGVLGKIGLGYISNWAMKSRLGFFRIATTGKTNRTLVLVVTLLSLLAILLLFGTYDYAPSFIFLVVFGIGLFVEGAVIIVSLTSMDVVPEALSGTGQATSAAFSQMVGRSLAGWPFSVLIDLVGWRRGFLALFCSCLLAVAVSTGLVISFHAQSSRKKKL